MRPAETEALRDALIQVVLAPCLVGASTLAARRWGQHIGGLVSAFPAVVGPVLLVAALDHGAAFAARAASGTLLGLVALSGFVVVYGRLAQRVRWPASLLGAWAAAAALALAVGAVGAGLPGALAAAVLSLAGAFVLLPRGGGGDAWPAVPRWDLPVRMALTAALVVALSAAATWLGPVVGGILAALPVLASILAVFTHERHGAVALADLLRGMVTGMAGFVAFCAVVGALVESAGLLAAFTGAAFAGISVQLWSATGLKFRRRRPTTLEENLGKRERRTLMKVLCAKCLRQWAADRVADRASCPHCGGSLRH